MPHGLLVVKCKYCEKIYNSFYHTQCPHCSGTRINPLAVMITPIKKMFNIDQPIQGASA